MAKRSPASQHRCQSCGKTSWETLQMWDCGNCPKQLRCICGGMVFEMTDKEIKVEKMERDKEMADHKQSLINGSKLPEWCLSAISQRAYEEGHAAGQREVDMIEAGMIREFETAMRCRHIPRES